MAVIHLVRHAPTPETGSKLTGRLPGVGLANDGRALARGAAELLRTPRLGAVYTSPIQRCRETAEIVAGPHDRTPQVLTDVQEVDFGKWQGRTLASLRKLKAWDQVVHHPSRMRFPDGESLLEAQQRAVAAIEGVAADHGRDHVAVCSHADIIKAVISHYLGQPLDLFQRILISPASVSTIHLGKAGGPMVISVNRRHA
jgi:probable phosphomutase (TIGR03848 family)